VPDDVDTLDNNRGQHVQDLQGDTFRRRETNSRIGRFPRTTEAPVEGDLLCDRDCALVLAFANVDARFSTRHGLRDRPEWLRLGPCSPILPRGRNEDADAVCYALWALFRRLRQVAARRDDNIEKVVAVAARVDCNASILGAAVIEYCRASTENGHTSDQAHEHTGILGASNHRQLTKRAPPLTSKLFDPPGGREVLLRNAAG